MAGEKVYIADKETLDKIYNILAVDPIYGFIEHMNILSPTQRIEYIGLNKNFTPVSRNTNGSISLNDWAGFEILEANKPYMVRSDGTPDYRLQDNDYSKKYSDGSASDVANTSYDGGAFSWLQKIYKNETVVGDDRIVKFSLTKREGYEPVGFIDPDNKELEGVWLPMFYGSIVEDKMRSLSGLQPDYNKTTAAQKTAIDAVGNRAKFLGGAIVETIADLLLMFGKNSNIQDVFGYGNCSGYDQSLTPTMGVKQNAVVGGGQFYATTDQKSLNKIFHSIVLGSYQQWMRDPYTPAGERRLQGQQELHLRRDRGDLPQHRHRPADHRSGQVGLPLPLHRGARFRSRGNRAVQRQYRPRRLRRCLLPCRRHKGGPTVRHLRLWHHYGASVRRSGR